MTDHRMEPLGQHGPPLLSQLLVIGGQFGTSGDTPDHRHPMKRKGQRHIATWTHDPHN